MLKHLIILLISIIHVLKNLRYRIFTGEVTPKKRLYNVSSPPKGSKGLCGLTGQIVGW